MEIISQAVKMFYGSKQALKGVDLNVNAKEFVGIIGPNGSGKSTFLKCIYRVQKPSGGTIILDGKRLDELTYRESALKLAVVAQHNFYNFEFDVLEIVLMGRSPHKKFLARDNLIDYNIACEALRLVGLNGFEKRNFSTLSGGEKQRVILARALAQQTECLVLDEPTNHLDIKYQLEIMDIVKSLRLTTLAAIHDLNIAAAYCDKLIAMKDGLVVGAGVPKELLTEKFIYDLYGLKAHVNLFDQNQLNIVYVPKHRQENMKICCRERK